MRKLTALALAVVMFGAPLALQAADPEVPEGAKALVAKLKAVRPDLPVEGVHATPIEDIYGLELPDGTVLYGTADGRHLFAGDLYVLGEQLANFTESRRTVQRRALMKTMPLEDMVVFSPDKETRKSVYVFTDVDCGYCRKLHQEMADLNDRGIEVRYLAYPRAGIGSDSYRKIVSAWCSDDQREALTKLKLGGDVPEKSCVNPVAAQYDLGRKVGISGTPAIVTEDGQLFPGYMPAAQLAAQLGLN